MYQKNEQMQQNTYERKKKINILPEALMSTPEKKHRKTQPQNNVYPKLRNKTERKPKELNCRYCHAPK